jgi:hypothetical protein
MAAGTGSRNTTVKILGGIGLAALVTLGAAACGSSHSSTSSVQSAAQVDQQIQNSAEMKQITRLYWMMANDGTLPFSSADQFESYMGSGPGEGNLETGMLGVAHGILPGTQEHDDFMNYALKEASKSAAAQKADWASYGFGVGNLWSNSGGSSSTPAPAPAPASAPATDATATALANAVMTSGPSTGVTVTNYAISSDGNYAAAKVNITSTGEGGIAWFSLANGTWTSTTVNQDVWGCTASLAKMPVSDFNEVTNAVEHTTGVDYNTTDVPSS